VLQLTRIHARRNNSRRVAETARSPFTPPTPIRTSLNEKRARRRCTPTVFKLVFSGCCS
jgi:hypothetical protein